MFVVALLQRLMDGFNEVLAARSGSVLEQFGDVVFHDGCSMAVHESLADIFPGRFTATSPAAIELHVSMSAYKDQPIRFELTSDREAEQNYGLESERTKDCLVLKDRGYESRRYLMAVDAAGAHCIVRGKLSIRPEIERAVVPDGAQDGVLRGMKLEPSILPYHDLDLDISWGRGRDQYRGRLIVLYTPRAGQEHLYLHTIIARSKASARQIGDLYRLRWQTELLFKEWKSYANPRKFSTSNENITIELN